MKSPNAEDRYQQLATKWLDKTITADEQSEFAAWYNANQGTPLPIPTTFAQSEAIQRERILNRIDQAIKKNDNHSKRIISLKWASIAACFLLMLAGLVHFHLKTVTPKKSGLAFKKLLKNDAAPGGDKALLTLSDGRQIVLNDAKNGVITSQGHTKINKEKNNQLVYDASPSQVNSPVVYNTISTPKGGQFQIVLSDGSKVWLNAASSIKFPTVFSKSARLVTISGEVYFEVAKNAHQPFKVVAGKQTVEVLGTHFNINAYDDERSIKTTLVEGSVKVSAGAETSILKPAQQSAISRNGSDAIQIKAVDTENVLAWTTGNFEFEKAEVSDIMRQAARWYDITVKYEGAVSPRRFTGSISRNVNLSELLKMLKYTGVNFKIEGKTLIVTS
jgi:ferric-dicitrate binding protein FerR (iron transport regulator)